MNNNVYISAEKHLQLCGRSHFICSSNNYSKTVRTSPWWCGQDEVHAADLMPLRDLLHGKDADAAVSRADSRPLLHELRDGLVLLLPLLQHVLIGEEGLQRILVLLGLTSQQTTVIAIPRVTVPCTHRSNENQTETAQPEPVQTRDTA